MISVIVPVYNAEKTLKRCLESVLGQSEKNLELLVIDDGSNDGSSTLLDFYKPDRRVRIFQQDNKGPSAARNLGLSHAQGEYVFFLDADDWLEPSALGALRAGITASKADIAVGNFRKVLGEKFLDSGNERYLTDTTLLDEKRIVFFSLLYAQTPYVYILLVHCWGKLYRRDILEREKLLFDEELSFFEDVHFNFRYLLNVKNLLYIHEPLLNYQVSGSLSSQSFTAENSRQYLGFLRAFAPVGAYLSAREATGEPEQIVSHLFSTSVIMMLLRITSRPDADQKKLLQLVRDLLNNGEFRRRFQFYRPKGNDSRLIPILVKLKLPRLLIMYSRMRYQKHRSRVGK